MVISLGIAATCHAKASQLMRYRQRDLINRAIITRRRRQLLSEFATTPFGRIGCGEFDVAISHHQLEIHSLITLTFAFLSMWAMTHMFLRNTPAHRGAHFLFSNKYGNLLSSSFQTLTQCLMEHGGSKAHLQGPSNNPYPVPNQTNSSY